METSKIASNLIKSVATGQLSAANVRLAGVGLEETGVQEFVQGGFFKGDLYIDEGKKSYAALGYRRFGIFALFQIMLSRIARDAMGRAKERKITGDLKGDGFQNGGLLVVDKGGKVLYHFHQQNPADHATNEDVLKALNLPLNPPTSTPPPVSSEKSAECADTCSFTPKAKS